MMYKIEVVRKNNENKYYIIKDKSTAENILRAHLLSYCDGCDINVYKITNDKREIKISWKFIAQIENDGGTVE